MNDYSELTEWLISLPKTKRGKDPYVFGNVMKGTIAFLFERDAIAFVIKFGAKPVSEEDRHRHRMRKLFV